MKLKVYLQSQCKYGCSGHQRGDWYDKKMFTNPFRAYTQLRKTRIENPKSTYRLKLE